MLLLTTDSWNWFVVASAMPEHVSGNASAAETSPIYAALETSEFVSARERRMLTILRRLHSRWPDWRLLWNEMTQRQASTSWTG